MGNRRALLIGAEEYGEGFVALPSVRQDLDMLGKALRLCGYEVTLVDHNVVNSASNLDKEIRRFCENGRQEDVRVIYFSGHGIRVDNSDCIIPARTNRKDAEESPNQRVSTDFSGTVVKSKVGLVVFIIDACREEQDIAPTKGGTDWGTPSGIKIPDEHRFIRFFGCSAGQLCKVDPDGPEGKPVSAFTKGLVDSLNSAQNTTLQACLKAVKSHCEPFSQTPRLSYGGEYSTDIETVLELPIFNRVKPAGSFGVWERFDPDKLHCLVVTSEQEARTPLNSKLENLVRRAFSQSTVKEIWDEFRTYCNGRKLLSGKRRNITAEFNWSKTISLGCFSANEAFLQDKYLEEAIRVLVEADLVVFDVTAFEPAVMLLIGIRTSCCRGVNICSHGNGWIEGQPIETLPFNLRDLNLNSHTSVAFVGDDPVLNRFVNRVKTAFTQISLQPHYLDLPAYDSLRQLGLKYEASSTIGLEERALVLCSYGTEYQKNWEVVSSALNEAMAELNRFPKISRIIDYGEAQLISKTIYEQIRRVAACVIDWTGYNASAFLELGVRLAVSPYGAVHIAEKSYLVGGKKAHEQIDSMQRLLQPIAYDIEETSQDSFNTIAQALIDRNPPNNDAVYNLIHRTVVRSINEVKDTSPSVFQNLTEVADSLHHPNQSRQGIPQILFYESRAIKADAERNALEYRIAAWFYLDKRLKAGETADSEQKKCYCDLGTAIISDLYGSGEIEDIELAQDIENIIKTAKGA